MLRAELDGVVCSGPRTGKQFTYALLDERVPPAKPLSRDEALAKLTRSYFRSHGPATLQDFVWWSGLAVVDARRGMELAGEKETRMTRISTRIEHACHLLPAFDEYFVAYKTREGGLGPTIIIDGRPVGTWKPATINLNVLKNLTKPEQRAIAKATERYKEFLLDKSDSLPGTNQIPCSLITT